MCERGSCMLASSLQRFKSCEGSATPRSSSFCRSLNRKNTTSWFLSVRLHPAIYGTFLTFFSTITVLEGGELFHQIVKLTYFSENLSRHVILQVAQGIRYLHEERGVVHRDIKPENLLFERIPIVPSKNAPSKQFDEDKEDEGEFIPGIGGGGIGRVKIADFGLSKVVWDEQTMTPCGTVGYTAPEIVKDERYSKSVDMWAMGCVLYTLLCGFPPFYDESINVLTEKVARGHYTFLSPWWDTISDSGKLPCNHPLLLYRSSHNVNQPRISLRICYAWTLLRGTPLMSSSLTHGAQLPHSFSRNPLL